MKLLGLTQTKKILLYAPLLKQFIYQRLQVTSILPCHKACRPFQWFPKEEPIAKKEGYSGPTKKVERYLGIER